MPSDYPDGTTPALPGNTVELEAGFAIPWYQAGSIGVAAGASGSFTLTFNDPYFIYFVDSINVTATDSNSFNVLVTCNGIPFISGAGIAWLNIPLRQNRSLLFLNDDVIVVTVTSYSVSALTYTIKLMGTAILRPTNYVHAAIARFSTIYTLAVVGQPIPFTNLSQYHTLGSVWTWFDGSEDSVDANPSHAFIASGVYVPKLRVSCSHNYDTYYCNNPITVCDAFPWATCVENDPGSKVVLYSNAIRGNLVPQTEDAYVYYDYGVDRFNFIYAIQQVRLLALATSLSDVFILGYSNGVGNLYTQAGVKIVVYFNNAVGVYSIRLAVMNGTIVTAYDSYIIDLSSYYYIIVERASGSTTVTCKIYSNISYSELLDTLTVTNAAVNTVFRYLYAYSTKHDDAAATSTIEDVRLGIL
jgi:hypothetical protein